MNELQKLLYILTTKEVEGKRTSNYCLFDVFTSYLDNYDENQFEEVVKLVSDYGFIVYDVYKEDEIEDTYIIAQKDCDIESIKDDYKVFFDVNVDVEPLKLNETLIKNDYNNKFAIRELDCETPYMLRRDNYIWKNTNYNSVDDIHPNLVDIIDNGDDSHNNIEQYIDALKDYKNGQKLIDDLCILGDMVDENYSSEEVDEDGNELYYYEKSNWDEIQDFCDDLSYELANIFVKFRIGDNKWNSSVTNKMYQRDIYFRVYSNDKFNWFDSIWILCYIMQDKLRTIYIEKTFDPYDNGWWKGYKLGRYDTQKGIPVKDFIELKGNQYIESLELNESFVKKFQKHNTLNPKLWNKDNTLKEEVREKIIQIVDEFVEGLTEDGIKINIKDIVIVGSNCSYNYTNKSDLDVHIKVDLKELNCPDNLYPLLYSSYRSIFNKKYDINFYGVPVELYVETTDDEELNESLILESKQDELNFKNWLNNDEYTNLFIKLRQSFKNPENDYYYWIKKKQPKDLISFIDDYQEQKAAKEKEHQETMQGAEYIGEGNGYKVYHITTWEASKTLGQGAKWCISMKDNSDYWNYYTSKGIKFYFFISSNTKYALALYPKTLSVYEFIDDNTILIKSNFEIYNAKDNLDYQSLDILPLNLISENFEIDKKDVENGLYIEDNVLVKVRKDLEEVVIPNSVKSIDNSVFRDCLSLTSITIPDSVTNIGNYTFRDCTSLTSITIPNSVTSIGNYAFWNCKSLTSVTIKNGVTKIGNNAFWGCTSLTSITIPESVTSIGYEAFRVCTSLRSITIPNSVTSMGGGVFFDCNDNLIVKTNNQYVIDYCDIWDIKVKNLFEEDLNKKKLYKSVDELFNDILGDK